MDTTTPTHHSNIISPIADSEIIIGVDEAGRGPLFGSVYTSAVTFLGMGEHVDAIEFDFNQLKDSKRFTSKKKIRQVFNSINNHIPLHEVDSASVEEIDKLNILQATQRSMHRCIQRLIKRIIEHEMSVAQQNGAQNHKPLDVLRRIKIYVDGNYFNTFSYFLSDGMHVVKHQTIIKGDSLSKEISAASILAKVSRDDYVEEFVTEHPEYNEKYDLLKNKGYGTKSHIAGIREFGYSPFHRRTFRLKCI